MAAVPPLFSDLAAAVDLDPSQAAAIRGPRLWWCGPLDVEGLALGSAQAAATGLSHLTGRDLSVDAERVAASFASISHLRVNGRRPQTAGALSGFHATADGWVRLHGNYPHHARAIERASGPRILRGGVRRDPASPRGEEVPAGDQCHPVPGLDCLRGIARHQQRLTLANINEMVAEGYQSSHPASPEPAGHKVLCTHLPRLDEPGSYSGLNFRRCFV